MTREIELSQGLVALVDDADYEQVAAVGKWYACRNGQTFYARKNFNRGGRQWSVIMHSVITGWPLVDHINGNGLDNRRLNLRQATVVQNARNRRRRSDNTSGYKGVSQRAPGRFRAYIEVSGTRENLGNFATPEQAARAYDRAALAYFGDFAKTNFSRQDYAA